MKNVLLSPTQLSDYAKQQIDSISYAIPNFKSKKKETTANWPNLDPAIKGAKVTPIFSAADV